MVPSASENLCPIRLAPGLVENLVNDFAVTSEARFRVSNAGVERPSTTCTIHGGPKW